MTETIQIPIESAKRMFTRKRYHKPATEKVRQQTYAREKTFSELTQEWKASLQIRQADAAIKGLIRELKQKESERGGCMMNFIKWFAVPAAVTWVWFRLVW